MKQLRVALGQSPPRHIAYLVDRTSKAHSHLHPFTIAYWGFSR